MALCRGGHACVCAHVYGAVWVVPSCMCRAMGRAWTQLLEGTEHGVRPTMNVPQTAPRVFPHQIPWLVVSNCQSNKSVRSHLWSSTQGSYVI